VLVLSADEAAGMLEVLRVAQSRLSEAGKRYAAGRRTPTVRLDTPSVASHDGPRSKK
jgi:hypothetical protein